MINPENLRRRDNVSVDTSSEGSLLLRDDGTYIVINSTGKAIWDILDKPRTVNEITHILSKTYENVTEEEIEPSTLSFINMLFKAGFLVDK